MFFAVFYGVVGLWYKRSEESNGPLRSGNLGFLQIIGFDVAFIYTEMEWNKIF